MFINFNISVLVPIFPAKGSITIPFLHGLFSASGGMFLIMKLIYVGTDTTLKSMATFYAVGTVIMHIHTFLFTPFKEVPRGVELSTYSVFQNSIIGKFLTCGGKSVVPSRQGEKAEETVNVVDTGPTVKDSLLSLKFLSICVYCVILQTRMNSIPGWTFSWLQWVFGDPSIEGNEGATDKVNVCMDIFGFMFFASILISPVPSLVIKWRTAVTGSIPKGKVDGLNFLILFTTLLGTLNSIQMCFQDSYGNAIAFVILFQFQRNFFFVSRSVFLYTYFPVQHFSILLGVSLLPIIASTFMITVFYQIIMGDALTIYDADFLPVNVGFAIACGLAFYQLVYNIFLGRELVRQAAAAKAGGVDAENLRSPMAQRAGVQGVETENERTKVDEKGFENTAFESKPADNASQSSVSQHDDTEL